MEKDLLNKLDSLIGVRKPTEVWVVFYNEKQLVFPSGKNSWKSIGAAKNALRTFLYPVGNWRTRLEEIKKLEEKGIIRYEKLL